MTHQKSHSLEAKSKDDSKQDDNPPVHAIHSLRRDVNRKRENMQKSTLGGY